MNDIQLVFSIRMSFSAICVIGCHVNIYTTSELTLLFLLQQGGLNNC